MKRLWIKQVKCRPVAVLLAVVLLALALAGCGNQKVEGNTVQDSGKREDTRSEDGQDGAAAMGRYGEEEIDLSEELEVVSGMKLFADGTLVITDRFSGLWQSEDKGASWEEVKNEWLGQRMDNTFFLDIQMSSDGTLGVVYSGYDEQEDGEASEQAENTGDGIEQAENTGDGIEQAENTGDGIEQAENAGDGMEQAEDEGDEEASELEDEFHPVCALVKSDGTVVPVELSLTEDDMYPKNIWMSEQGRIFVTTQGDNIYEVWQDGSSERFLTLEGSPQLIQFIGNLMLIDGYDFDAPILYDMDKNENVEDEVFAEFIRENYGDRGFNGGSWYDLYVFPESGKAAEPGQEEEGVIYLAGEKGLHRHVIGQEGVEQLIDGNLSQLGSPLYSLKSMTALEDGEFLAVSSGGKLVRFTYDPDMPAVPQENLKIYSLKESYSVRTAISIFQVQNPDVYVTYEIGMEDGGAVTREDALKKLNTRIIAGEGPDLILLDELPVDSYMEKGLLLEIGDFMEEIGEEEELYDNLYLALAREGKVYGIPGEVSLPVMLGRGKYVSDRKSLVSMAEGIELIRSENPGKDILGICSEKGVMKMFAPICAPAWKKDNGEIDKDAIGEFLTQTKRIYDAQMEGINEESLNRFIDNNEYWIEEFGEDWVYDISFFGEEYLYYAGGYQQLSVGENNYPYGYYGLTSASRVPGLEDTTLIWMENGGGKYFIPKSILGINAASSKTELAKEFVKAFLGEEIQYALGGYVLNKAAFDRLFTPDEKYIGEDGVYSVVAITDGEGMTVSMNIYPPGQKELDVLKGWMASADTPYIADIVLEKAVFEEGEAFMKGEQSLEEALDAIGQRLAIYMAE